MRSMYRGIAFGSTSGAGQPVPQPDAALDFLWQGSTYSVPSAWYPDPLVRAELRYWDGHQWTHHVSTAGQQHDERESTSLVQALSVHRRDQLATAITAAVTSAEFSWEAGAAGQAAWHASLAFHIARMSAPVFLVAPRKGGATTSMGVGYLLLGRAGLIVGPIANALHKRYQRSTNRSQYIAETCGLAAMMLGASEKLLGALPLSQTRVQTLYAWHFLTTEGKQCASYEDAVVQVALASTDLIGNYPAVAAQLLRYARHFQWTPILNQFASIGFIIHDLEEGSLTDEIRHAYDVLQLHVGASRDEIRAAYHKAAREWHPDTLGNIPPHVRKLAEERMAAINAAYDLIMSQAC